MFTAISLIIFIIEIQIPPIVPIPGIKLGLANIISLVAVFLIGRREAFFIVILRIFLGSLYAGNVQTFIYSISGGILCYIVTVSMSFILKTDKIWLISVFGALSHVIGQLIAAYLLINLKQILYFAPILMLSAIITGIFTGVTSQLIYKRMKNIKLK